MMLFFERFCAKVFSEELDEWVVDGNTGDTYLTRIRVKRFFIEDEQHLNSMFMIRALNTHFYVYPDNIYADDNGYIHIEGAITL